MRKSPFSRKSKLAGMNQRRQALYESAQRIIKQGRVRNPQGYNLPQPPSQGPTRRWTKFARAEDAQRTIDKGKGGLRTLAAADYLASHGKAKND